MSRGLNIKGRERVEIILPHNMSRVFPLICNVTIDSLSTPSKRNLLNKFKNKVIEGGFKLNSFLIITVLEGVK